MQQAINSTIQNPQGFMLKVDAPRAALRAVQFAVSYLLMLIAMTFNVGLFFALVVGVFFGNLVFGRHLAVADTDCCN